MKQTAFLRVLADQILDRENDSVVASRQALRPTEVFDTGFRFTKFLELRLFDYSIFA